MPSPTSESTQVSLSGYGSVSPVPAPFWHATGTGTPLDAGDSLLAKYVWVKTISMMALPEQVFARPGFGDRVAAIADGHEAFAPPGPSRPDLLKTLA